MTGQSAPNALPGGRTLLRLLAILLCTFALLARPAAAQQILRDAETEALFNDISRPLISAAKLDPKNVQVLLINDPEINAFVAGGQYVWIHSGLIASADDVNQVQGVIAHELGHIEGGHIIRSSEGIKTATNITLLSLVLGAAAIAAGGGEAGMGIMAAGQQAAMGKYLAFSRTQESSADLAGARYLSAAGISGKGSLAFFKKLQNQEYRLAIPQDDSYARTHPLSGERIAVLREVYEPDPAWNAPINPTLEQRFERVKAKLVGFVSDPPRTLQLYPETDKSIPAHYARAYAWHKSAYPDKAMAEVQALLAAYPHDPYFLELEGQILLESGHPAEAIPPLREAVAQSNNQPLISVLLGHALIATEDDRNFKEAEQVLRTAIARDRENPFAWYQLGVVYEHRGDTPRAALATAERYNMEGNNQLALLNADQAMQGLKEGTTDWLRAQDIAMVSRAAVDANRKKKR
ncbi:MAG TPA: M48 family metalloprotease [Sphingobium sp.]